MGQVAPRFAESFTRQFKDIVELWGGRRSGSCRSSGVAHDLGHPPFGHIAEKDLDRLIAAEIRANIRGTKWPKKVEHHEGYEGNAQSFRIVTNLAVRGPDTIPGLDLTGATLNAILKYPWKWRENPGKPNKYGGLLFATMSHSNSPEPIDPRDCQTGRPLA